MSLISVFKNLSLCNDLLSIQKNIKIVRNIYRYVEKPLPGVGGKSYRRIVHYPVKYTVKPLDVTNLAGRDPVTGRVVAKGIGGGIKHKYHWIDWIRIGPAEGPPQVKYDILTFFSKHYHFLYFTTGTKSALTETFFIFITPSWQAQVGEDSNSAFS